MDPSPETTARKRRLSSFHRADRTKLAGPSKTPRRPSLRLPENARQKISLEGTTPRRSPLGVPTPTSGTAARSRNSGGSRTPGTPRTPRGGNTPNKHLSAQDITAMYASTIKLCQDNKINAKNSWSLNLIDYMGMLVRPDEAADPASTAPRASTEDVNFQLAGVTLDAGVRIYCSRVDSVHTNAFKVLTGLSRTTGGDNDGEEGGEDDDESTADATGTKRRRRGGVTLVNNMATITVQKMETDFAVDPLFQKMSAAYDDAGPKGLLLNNLIAEPSGYILLDSDEAADSAVPVEEEAEHAETYDIEKEFPTAQFKPNDTLCYRFVSFFNREMGSLQSAATPRRAPPPVSETEDTTSDITFEYEQGDMQGESALGVFKETPSFADGEDSFANDFGQDEDDFQMPNLPMSDDTAAGHVSVDNGSRASAALLGQVDLVEAGVALQTDSDYSFFDSMALSSWAGPQHWKFRNSTTSTTKSTKEAKRPRSKTNMLMDFSSKAPEIDFAAGFKSAKTAAATMLTKTALNAFSEKKVTLPGDLHYGARDLTKLYLMPSVKIALNGTQRTVAAAQEDTSGKAAWYDYDNDCDNENFVGEMMEPMDSMGADGDMYGTQSVVSGMELIAEPTMVDKIDISYAKVAKKVDVRKLKSGMWTHLCGGAEDAVLEENMDVNVVEPESDEVAKGKENTQSEDKDIRTGVTQKLSELVEDLPDILPGPALADVSLPYVFICLLHLANEKTLCISSEEEGQVGDLVITRDGERGADAQ